MGTSKDFSPNGTKLEGQFENDRNAEHSDLFKAIIRHAYNVQDVIIGHHLIYEKHEKDAKGYEYDIVQEIPSADALIFDHAIASKIWPQHYVGILQRLAALPIDQRDKALRHYWDNRDKLTPTASDTYTPHDTAKALARVAQHVLTQGAG